MTDTVHITVLRKDACSLCDHAKQALQNVGRDYPLDVTEISMDSENGQELAHNAGVMFPPGVLVNGEFFSHGRLSERKLRRTLAKLGTTGTGRARP